MRQARRTLGWVYTPGSASIADAADDVLLVKVEQRSGRPWPIAADVTLACDDLVTRPQRTRVLRLSGFLLLLPWLLPPLRRSCVRRRPHGPV